MLRFLGKAMAGLVLTKDGRKAAADLAAAKTRGKAVKAPPAKAAAPAKAAEGKAAAIAELQSQAKDLVTPERAELIRRAMEVRAAKQTILADLSDESRAKLVATAMKALLNEGREKDGKKE